MDNDSGAAAPDTNEAPVIPDAPAPDSFIDEPETGSVTADEIADVLHLPKNEAPAEEVDDAPVNDKPADPVDDSTNTEQDAGATDTAAKPAEVPKGPAEPAETPAAETPDFSFTVEGADGNTYKISPDATMEQVLAEWEPKNNGQIIDVLEQLRTAKESQKNYESEQATAQEETARNERIAAIQDGWANEAKALVADGRLENSTDLMNSDRVKEVFAYMKEENDKRAADGRPQIGSLEDAFDKLELKEQREAAKADKDTARTRARQNGSLVGGRSAPAPGTGAAYVAGSARTADQALRQAGLLR